MNNKTIKDLYEFIDRASKSRRYPPNTAHGLKAALKLFEEVSNEEERNSIETFNNNLESIYRDVATRNGKKFTANSLAAYKYRVSKILKDFNLYGIDPTKMSTWSPKLIIRTKKNATETAGKGNILSNQNTVSFMADNSHVFEFGDIKLVIKKTPRTEEAIMDGKFSEIRTKLKKIANDLTEKNQEEADPN